MGGKRQESFKAMCLSMAEMWWGNSITNVYGKSPPECEEQPEKKACKCLFQNVVPVK